MTLNLLTKLYIEYNEKQHKKTSYDKNSDL